MDTKHHCQDSIEVLVHRLYSNFSAANRSRPHHGQIVHESDDAELVLLTQSWKVHVHDRVAFCVNLLIFSLTHTAAA